MASIRERALTAVDALWEGQVDFLRVLVRIPSVLHCEAPAQALMDRTFRAMGLETDRFEIDPGTLCRLPGYSPVEWGYRGRPVVVGRLPSPVQGGRCLVLNGHVDVVSPEPVRLWSRDPWGAEVTGGRMYGRGVLDMKAGVSANVFAVRALQRAGVVLEGDLLLHSVIEEECTGNGTLACLARGYVGDGAVIPEPEDEACLAGELGVLWLRTVVTGSAGHVLGAQAHVNAIEKCFDVIRALRVLEAAWNADPHPAFRAVEHPINFNPGVIRGGDWPSTVPAECEFTTRLSFYPGIRPEEAKALVLDHLRRTLASDPWLRAHPPAFTWFGHHDEGYLSAPSDPVIAAVQAAHREVSGHEAGRRHGTAVTDARFWQLYHDKPATCYGPRGENMHGTDEWVDLDSLRTVTKALVLTVIDWCGAR
jgi:acetylornithine deacetylase